MMDLLIGTHNPGKLREYREMFKDLPVRVFSLKDVGLESLEIDEPEPTYEGNARLKAEAYQQASNMIALADDSGLDVDALDGRPGVLSARYGGPTDHDRRVKLLGELKGVADADRTARFVCVTIVATPDGVFHEAKGVCEGTIAREESEGLHGFGYDAIFVPQGHDNTLADIPPEQKHDISHRGRALKALRPIIERLARDNPAN